MSINSSTRFVSELTPEDLKVFLELTKTIAEQSGIRDVDVLKNETSNPVYLDALKWKPERLWLAKFIVHCQNLMKTVGFDMPFEELKFKRWGVVEAKKRFVKTEFERIADGAPNIGKVLGYRKSYMYCQRLIYHFMGYKQALNTKGEEDEKDIA